MQHNVTCYKLVNGKLHPVKDVTGATQSGNVPDTLSKLGYARQIRSEGHRHPGAEISVWSVRAAELPPFFIEVVGATDILAVLIADDFAHLTSTLQQINSLIALVGSDAQTQPGVLR